MTLDDTDDEDDMLLKDIGLSCASRSLRRCSNKRKEAQTTLSSDRNSLLLQDALKDFERERYRESKMRLLQSQEKQVLQKATEHQEMVQRQQLLVKGQQSLSFQDKLSGMADLYHDFHVFPDKSIVEKRIKAMDSSSFHRYGGRSNLIQFSRTNASPCGKDPSLASMARAYISFEEASEGLQSILLSTKIPDWEPNSIGVARLRRFLITQLSDGSINRVTKMALTRWLYRVAMTGSGSTEGTSPAWAQLSEAALKVLVHHVPVGVSDNSELNSLDLFHCCLDCYRLTARDDRQLNAITAVCTNEQGLENLLTYWNDERLLRTNLEKGTADMLPSLVLQLSRLLLDESLSSLRHNVQRSLSALVRLSSQLSSPPEQTYAVTKQIGRIIFNDLATTLGPPPLTDNVKIVDDEQASLATAYLLDNLLSLPDDSSYYSVSFFQLECAYQAFANLGIENVREASGHESYAELLTIPPSGDTNSEWWPVTRQAILTSVYVLQVFPHDKTQGPRCLAILDSALALFRTGLGWWPAALKTCSPKTTVSQGGDAEFGAPDQAKAIVEVMQKLSSVLEEVGHFADRFSSSEHFRCISEHVHLFDRYMAGIALTRCCSQGGVSMVPKALQQQTVTKYFDVKSP